MSGSPNLSGTSGWKALPISFFKQEKIVTGQFEPAIVFTSSGTTGMVNSAHYVKDEQLYINSFLQCFRQFYGDEKDFTFVCLLPSYLERAGSSLIYMMDYLVKASGKPQSGFYPQLNDDFFEDLNEETAIKIFEGIKSDQLPKFGSQKGRIGFEPNKRLTLVKN